MIEGVDCASPVRDAAALKRAGKSFVCRYLTNDDRGNQWKTLSLSEAKRIRQAGLSIAVVFETSARRALNGRQAGRDDAAIARLKLNVCGLPANLPVYFAVDFDARPEQQPVINEYLFGAASVLGHDHVGVYGGYWVVKRCLDAGVCSYGWQTYAWSGGRWDGRAHLQQYRNGVRLGGIEVDLDRAIKRDFGQFPRPVTRVTTDSRPEWAKRGDHLAPMWAWFLWKDHGAPKGLRPKQVPARVPMWWWARYALHRGLKGARAR